MDRGLVYLVVKSCWWGLLGYQCVARVWTVKWFSFLAYGQILIPWQNGPYHLTRYFLEYDMKTKTEWNFGMIEVLSVFMDLLIFLVLSISIFHAILRKVVSWTARTKIVRHTETTETRVTWTMLDKIWLMRYEDF